MQLFTIHRFYWLVNLNSTVVFLGIAYIQQSVAKNLCFLIPFTSVLLALIAIHMVRNKLTFRPKKGNNAIHNTYTQKYIYLLFDNFTEKFSSK